KVFLVHLQEEAEVTRLSGAGMLYVKLDDIEIPVYLSDVSKNIPLHNAADDPKKTGKKNGAEKKVAETEESFKGSDSGIFLAFEPVKDVNDAISHFKITLVNDTSSPVSFRYHFSLVNDFNFELEKIVLPYHLFLLREIEHDALNEITAVA